MSITVSAPVANGNVGHRNLSTYSIVTAPAPSPAPEPAAPESFIDQLTRIRTVMLSTGTEVTDETRAELFKQLQFDNSKPIPNLQEFVEFFRNAVVDAPDYPENEHRAVNLIVLQAMFRDQGRATGAMMRLPENSGPELAKFYEIGRNQMLFYEGSALSEKGLISEADALQLLNLFNAAVTKYPEISFVPPEAPAPINFDSVANTIKKGARDHFAKAIRWLGAGSVSVILGVTLDPLSDSPSLTAKLSLDKNSKAKFDGIALNKYTNCLANSEDTDGCNIASAPKELKITVVLSPEEWQALNEMKLNATPLPFPETVRF